MPINKYSYDPQTIKYYDFVNDFLKNQVSFIKNNLPEYCNKDVSISYLLPIGNK